MSTIYIRLPINPADLPTSQQKGARVIGRHVQFYTKPRVRESKNQLVTAMWAYALRFRETVTGDVPVYVSIHFAFPFPKGTAKSRQTDSTPHIVRPDVDNLAKGLLDAMTEAGFWSDDSCVWSLGISKTRTTGEPHIGITITG